MGQKVHPNGIRLGITKPWNSTWFANTKDFADNLYSDFQVRQFLTKELKNASLSKITIERPAKSIRVTILWHRYERAVFLQICLPKNLSARKNVYLYEYMPKNGG